MNRAIGTVTASAVMAVTSFTSLALAVLPVQSNIQSTSVISKVVHKICPVANCSQYENPDDIRGTTVATLQNWELYIKSAELQIRTMPYWNENTARLQIEQDRLVHQDGHIDLTYLNAIRTIVQYALKHNKYVVLNAQTELAVGAWRNEPMPTLTTFRFWHIMNNLYGNNPKVMFDLFNEPRSPLPWNGDWSIWQTDFQSLVDTLRKWGSVNQIWVEAEDWASTFQGVPLLSGQGIVYEYHHPGCPHPYECQGAGNNGKKGLTPSLWETDFGYLSSIVPLVDGEFVNYLGGYYWPHSTYNVTRYFEFLHFHHIGLVSWSLQPGIMTTYNPRVPEREPISAGALFMKYYQGVPIWTHIGR